VGRPSIRWCDAARPPGTLSVPMSVRTPPSNHN
jgi:hypothetical protein